MHNGHNENMHTAFFLSTEVHKRCKENSQKMF